MSTILKVDARKIGTSGQYAKRLDVIRLLKEGLSVIKITKLLAVSKAYVYDIKGKYEQGGLEALKIKRRGRPKGEKRILTPEQEEDIRVTILEKTPDQLDFVEALWTNKVIRELIKVKFGIEVARSTLAVYLKRWELSPQRPITHARKQNPEAVEKWVNEEYPEICKRAREESAEILFGDETNIQNTTAYMRGYAELNHPPVVKVQSDGSRFKVNMISAISRKGKLRFMLYKDSMNQDKFLIFLRRLVRERSKKDGYEKLFFIVDNLKVHHGKKVTSWLEKHKDEIELFFLPAYSPEYNPDELLNSDIKRGVGAKFYAKTQRELEAHAYNHLRVLRNDPAKIRSFFDAPLTAYAG